MSDAILARYCHFFESLDSKRLDPLAPRIEELFDEAAEFRDPFNHVRGHGPIHRIFEHLLRDYPRTRFKVTESIPQGAVAYIRWTFSPDSEKTLSIEGVSRVLFGSDGKVLEHRDYWDSASELFARHPITGPPTRWLLRKAQACTEDQVIDTVG